MKSSSLNVCILTVVLAGCANPSTGSNQLDDQKIEADLSVRFSEYAQRRAAASQPVAAIAPTDAATVEAELKAWAERIQRLSKQPPGPGAVFRPDAADMVRRRLRSIFEGANGPAARAALTESLEEHIAAPGFDRIEVGQPVSAPELPFSLSEVLPRPPHGLEYRFLDDRLLLRDQSTSVLLDYVDNALPVPAPQAAQVPEAAKAPQRPDAAGDSIIDFHLPNKPMSVKFAVLGDVGAGRDRDVVKFKFHFEKEKFRAHAVAKLIEQVHSMFAFPMALMLGDNMYTDPDTDDAYSEENLAPYAALRKKGIVFRAVLGNHDNADFQILKPELNLEKRRFYAFEQSNVRFMILHSDEYMLHDTDPPQDKFIKETLSTSFAGWTIAAFHHPLYSSGKHRDQNAKARRAYQAVIKGPVRVVFTGHEHFYERTKTKPGPAHFVAGASARLRHGDLELTGDTETGFDDEHSFMLVEVDQDELYFQTMGLSGRSRDCGVLTRVPGTSLSLEAADWQKGCAKRIGS